MSEPDQREKAFLDAAMLLPREHRSRYLDCAAADDAPLRRRLESLMKAKEAQPVSPPDAPPLGPNQTVVVSFPLTEQPGDKIGRYKLLQQIGEGGCGVVYMAEQDDVVRRRVALKVIKLGMDTKNVIARFEAERQALAMMDHPNIARVLDAGATEAGRPYFVMELVRGVKITEYCDQHNLSTRDRLELFARVCHAIQHAHQKGIIHRDIKPSNILVTLHDGAPVPKVIDFGIAKATDQRLTDKTLFTSFEQFIGTPAYMSPEQAGMSGLDIDTRSDIYSLGVLLYELLTGKTPFDQKQLIDSGLDEMRRTIREREPERPSTRLISMQEGELTTTARLRRTDPPRLLHLVRGDLDWIVMKTLDKDRTRRYDTATGLALDVRRYLDNQPILARPPSRFYQFQKFTRRHRTAVRVGAVLGVVILALMVVLTEEYLRAERMSKIAGQNAKAAEEAAARAQNDAELARRAQSAEAQLHEQVEKRLALEAKMRADSEMGSTLSKAGSLFSRGEFKKAEELVNRMPPYPASAAMYNSLGLIHVGRAEWASAIRSYTKVVELAPLDHVAYHCLAPLLVYTGNIEDYNRHRERILRQFGRASDPLIAEQMAQDCLLTPPTSQEMEIINDLVATASSRTFGQKVELLKGLADYRAGRFADSADRLQKLIERGSRENASLEASTILAMDRQQLHQPEQARATLAGAMETARKKLPKLVRGELDQNWNDSMVCRILIREARALIEPASTGSQPAPSTAPGEDF